MIADKPYRFTDSYKGPANTVVAYVTLANGTVVKAGLDGGTDTYAASADFTTTNVIFYIPVNAKSVQIVHEPVTTDAFEAKDFNFGAVGYLTRDQALAMQAAGHEIGGHSETHPDLTMIDPGVAELEIARGRQDLVTHGISPAHSFAYPEGQHNAVVESILNDAGYESGRTVTEGISTKNTPKNGLLTHSVNADTTVPQIQAWITEARVDRHWLILVFHNISTDVTPESQPFGAFPGVLQATVDMINTQNVKVCTVDQGVRLMTSGSVSDCGASAPVDTAPVITLNGAANINLQVGDVFTDPGAVATDDHDASVTVIVGGDTVNTAVVGTYVITYDAEDSTGHNATQVTRTVNVSVAPDTTAPVITLVGDATITIPTNSTFIDPGATATDNIDGNLTAQILVGNTVDTAIVGTYYVTYDVTDAAGNPATQVVRTVVVESSSSGSGGGGGGGGGSVRGATISAHPNGTLVLDGTTIYLIKNGQRFGFRDANEYKTHGYRFIQAVAIKAADKSLSSSDSNIIKALPGTLVIDATDGRTVYMIGENNSKRGFASASVFTELGYRFDNLLTINLSDYTSGTPITDPTNTHPEGALVLDGQTVWWILDGKRRGFESEAVLNTYGFSYDRIVNANAADRALGEGSLVKFRDGTLVNKTGSYYIISDGKSRAFTSASVFSTYGYSQSNAITADLSNYTAGVAIK